MAWRTLCALVLAFASGCGLLVPRESFDETTPPDPPDYASDEAWAALPTTEDDADVTPAGETDGQADAEVDVFFVHPTTYYSGRSWNQPLDNRAANRITDEKVLRNQASVFNGVGRIYAPRYRQATLGAYLTDRIDDADAALGLAYEDVRDAFDAFLADRNDGRPFIIAGHSQGSRHGLRLLSERISDLAEDPSLRERMVAAYLIGGSFPSESLEDTIPGVPLCAAPDQTGCLVAYATIRAGSSGDRYDEIRIWTASGRETFVDPTLLCVNPVSWSTGAERTAREDHLGGVRFDDDLSPSPDPMILTAACEDGLLTIELFDDDYDTFGDDFHIHDYSLFYMDLRRNAEARVAAFLGG